jgi:hypothetical protein
VSFRYVVSVTLPHGAPHTPHAFGLVPARIHGSTSFSGKVAKCAPEKLWVLMVQTDRRLRVPPVALGSAIALES